MKFLLLLFMKLIILFYKNAFIIAIEQMKIEIIELLLSNEKLYINYTRISCMI